MLRSVLGRPGHLRHPPFWSNAVAQGAEGCALLTWTRAGGSSVVVACGVRKPVTTLRAPERPWRFGRQLAGRGIGLL
ncbi:hypothetical protein [Streptomyces acidiscabies]|uniref:hypothetical protein n=1 Tax=Streptomyces acidiscabies TaxID=42234 RepID=UPI0038F6A9AA